MAETIADFTELNRVQDILRSLVNIDFIPLMEEGARIFWEDNRRGLEAGLDCDDRPMPATWRERNPVGFWFRRAGGRSIHTRGSQEAGSGPPLLPNRESSRAIRDVQVSWTTVSPWQIALTWVGFDSDDGRSILEMHANPLPGAPYPRRDVISHFRPTAIRQFGVALDLFVESRFRKT